MRLSKDPDETFKHDNQDRCTCLATRMVIFFVWQARKLNFFVQLGFGKTHPYFNIDLDRYTYHGFDVFFSVL